MCMDTESKSSTKRSGSSAMSGWAGGLSWESGFLEERRPPEATGREHQEGMSPRNEENWRALAAYRIRGAGTLCQVYGKP